MMDLSEVLEIKIGPHSIFIKKGEKVPIRKDFEGYYQDIPNDYAGQEIVMELADFNYFDSCGYSWEVKTSVDFDLLRERYNLS